jgi:hypothetical protein
MIAARRNPASRLRRATGGLFTLLFGWVFLYFLLPGIVANLAAAGWTLSACEVLSSGVARQESSDGADQPQRTLYRLNGGVCVRHCGRRALPRVAANRGMRASS